MFRSIEPNDHCEVAEDGSPLAAAELSRWGSEFLRPFKNLAPTGPDTVASAKPTIKTMNYSLGTILAVIAIILVLATYLTGAPLVPVAVILLALAIIFGGNAVRPV